MNNVLQQGLAQQQDFRPPELEEHFDHLCSGCRQTILALIDTPIPGVCWISSVVRAHGKPEI